MIDDITGLKPGHDSSVALMEAAQLRGHRILITTAARLSYTDGRATAPRRPVTPKPAVRHDQQWIIDPEWFKLGPASLYRLGDAAAVFMRTDPPVDGQYLRATYLLDLVDATRTLMVNSPSGVRNANEKLFALRLPELGRQPSSPRTVRLSARLSLSGAVRCSSPPMAWPGAGSSFSTQPTPTLARCWIPPRIGAGARSSSSDGCRRRHTATGG